MGTLGVLYPDEKAFDPTNPSASEDPVQPVGAVRRFVALETLPNKIRVVIVT